MSPPIKFRVTTNLKQLPLFFQNCDLFHCVQDVESPCFVCARGMLAVHLDEWTHSEYTPLREMTCGAIDLDVLPMKQKTILYLHDNYLFRAFSDLFAGRFIKLYKPTHLLRESQKRGHALKERNASLIAKHFGCVQFNTNEISTELTPYIFMWDHVCAISEASPCIICGIGMTEDDIKTSLSRFAKTVLINTNNALNILKLDIKVLQKIYALKWHFQKLIAYQFYAHRTDPNVHKSAITQKHRNFRECLYRAVEEAASAFATTLSVC